MKNRRVAAGIVALLTVVSALAFLPATPAAAAVEEDVLYVAMQQDLPDFNNYNLKSNSVWKANVINYFFEGLSGTDYDLKSVPILAQNWTFYEDALKVEVNLRQGVKFHDGTTMDSDDVYFSYLMVRNGTTYSDRLVAAFDKPDPVTLKGDGKVNRSELDAGVKTNGTYGVTFTMAKPYGQFFSSAFAVPIVPRAIWEDHVVGDDEVNVLWGSDTAALIGTGPYKYAGGVTNSYRVIEKFTNYWGKDFNGPGDHWKTPAGWPLYPVTLDKVHYKIYASIDTAILALQGGDVDYISWAITPGRVPALQSDPNLELEYMSDAGYFYLAFNMKKEPMNNLSFRKAISHLIDKDQIVDVYMAGFGQAGSAAVPPFFGEWHNPAATKYPFDVAIANQLLDEAGYLDINGDGWRELPDRRLMEKITLLCPPADYDTIRIRAGQMIATNMRAAGINVEAKPIDFNTLVAKVTTFDYQMLELGWIFTGYTEAVSLLFDIYSPIASSNSWGFWSDANPNPLWSTIGGVSTLADPATQAMADQVKALEDEARGSFDVAEQIEKVKEAQQVIADAIPCNVLYYRVNVEAHNKLWTNWTAFDGRLINPFTWAVLDRAGGAGTEGGGKVAELDVGITMAEKIRCAETVTASVIAVDGDGEPVSGAAITVDASDGAVTVSPTSGTTNAGGVFEFEVTGVAVGMSTVRVNATSGSITANDTVNVRVSSLGGVAGVLTPEKTVLSLGESIDVDVLVTDVNGDPVAGANVAIDEYLLGYGSVTPNNVTTGANGMATMVYTAPADVIPGTHMLVQLAATVRHPMYALGNLISNGLVVRNSAAPDWLMTSIYSVSTTGLDQGDNVSTISTRTTNTSGVAVVGANLGISYSNDSLVLSPTRSVVTGSGGFANFTVTMRDLLPSGAVKVTIGNETMANAIFDSVTLTYARTGALVAGLYGGYVTYATPKFVGPMGSVDLSVHVFDSRGDPAPDGTSASVLVAATSYGQLTDWSGSEYNSLWDYTGVTVVTDADEQNVASAGSFSAPVYVEDWINASGVSLTGGVYDMTIEGVDLAQLDLAMSLYLIPEGTCEQVYIAEADTIIYEIRGETAIGSSYGYGRANGFTSVVFEIEKPVLAAKSSKFDMTNITVTVYNENNQPLNGADVVIYQAASSGGTISATDYWVQPSVNNKPTTQTSDSAGIVEFNATAAAYNSGTKLYTEVTRASNPIVSFSAKMAGKLRIMSQTQLVVEPLREYVFVDPEPITDVLKIGETVYVTATVTDKAGAPYADLPVSVEASPGVAATPTAVTDVDGVVTFAIDTSGISDSAAAIVVATVATGGTPEGATARVAVALQNTAPSIAVATPAADGEVEGSDAQITGSIFDANGIAEATLTIDDGTPIDLVTTEGVVGISISELVEDLDKGDHTLTVYANDSLGVSSEVEVDFSVVEEEGGSTMAWIVAGIGWAVAAAILVLMLMKMRKPPAATASETPEPPPAEEPKL